MKNGEVRKATFNNLEVTITKTRYYFIVKFENGVTIEVSDINNFTLKPLVL